MGNLNNVQRRLAEGTSSWLLFEFHCQRGDLFSEKYLSVPVGQVLAGLYPGRVKAEENHPYLIKKIKVQDWKRSDLLKIVANWSFEQKKKANISLKVVLAELKKLTNEFDRI